MWQLRDGLTTTWPCVHDPGGAHRERPTMHHQTRRLGGLLLGGVLLTAATACRPPTPPPQPAGTFRELAPVAPDPAAERAGFSSVSCPAADDCIAVGQLHVDDRYTGMAERWDGRRWTALPAPPTPAGRHLDLRTVDCPRRDHCVVVGATTAVTPDPPITPWFYDTAYVARWNGVRWTDETAGLAPGMPRVDALTDVSCVGDTCLAVGVHGEPYSSIVMTAPAFVSRGPRGGWARVPGPPLGASVAIGGLPGRYWLQLDCASTTSCAATTLLVSGVSVAAFASYWDGTSWTAPPFTDIPALESGYYGFLMGVDCPAPGQCLATGSGLERPDGTNEGLVRTWNGQEWVVTPLAGMESLGLVSCARVGRCLALSGWRRPEPAEPARSAVLDGTGWHPVPAPEPHDRLEDLSCAGTMCLTVGADDKNHPVAYRWVF
jgi:hypothetical protein